VSKNSGESSEEDLRTTLEDLDLERRFKNLSGDTEESPIEDGIPSKDGLQSLEKVVKDNLESNFDSN